MRVQCLTAVVLMSTVCFIGCASPSTGGSRSSTDRDPARAQRLHQDASEVMERDPERAEELLRQALEADLFHGPSHNNLGILLLDRGELYEASEEFDWARRLMPGHPAPRVNLAMTLERAGKVDDALEAYESALVVYENYLPALQGKARLQIRARRTDDTTPLLLDAIAYQGSEHWRDWATLWRAKLESE